MKLTKVVILTGLLSLMSVPVMAAEEAPNFSDIDANGDGGVDAAEFAKGKNSGIEKTFAEVDANKDGKISDTEYEVIKEPECDWCLISANSLFSGSAYYSY